MILNQFGITTFLESSKKGNVWKVIIIEEGLSKNGKYYAKEALQKSIQLFEKSKVCFYEWKDNKFDHMPMSIEKMRPEGFPLQTAGWLEGVKFETFAVEGREVSGLTGYLHLLEKSSKVQELKQMLSEAWKKGLKNLLGLSINAEGPSSVRMLNGQPITVVEAITKVFSTDFVTQPAAGGGLLALVESLNKTGGMEIMFKKLLEALKAWRPNLLENVNIENITQEEVVGIFESVLKDAVDKKSENAQAIESIVASIKGEKFEEAETLFKTLVEGEQEKNDADLMEADDAILTPEQLKKKKELMFKKKKESDDLAVKAKQDALDATNKDLESKFTSLEAKLKQRECKEMLDLALSESNLPMPVRNKIRQSFNGKVFKEAELKESIKLERTTLAQLVESQSIIDLGSGNDGSFVQRDQVTKLQASMDIMLGHNPTEEEKADFEGIDGFTSLKEAYVAFTDDPNITGRVGPKAMARLQEATEGDFSYALGYSMQRRMLPAYKAIDPQWKKIATSVPIKDFKLQERIRWGGFGVLPTVQNARTVAGTPIDSATPSYPELGFPTDEEATYAVATKGGIVTLTRRMIIDDDLKVLTAIPGKVGKAAAQTLNQFVFDLMIGYSTTGINVATIYDGLVMFVAGHKNYRTVALGYDSLSDLLDDMYYQVEFGTKTDVVDDPLTAGGTALVVTTGDGQYFKAGDLIWMAGEICRVDSVATDTLTIARGVYGTTAAEHAQGVDVYKVTQVLALENPNLWVPRSLRGTAMQLKKSEFNPESMERGVNSIRDSFDPTVTPYLRGDENNFYLSSKLADVEGIEMGFLNGREDPEILVQDQPTVGNVFVYDTIRYKVRHEYGGAVTDFRAFAGGIVS